MRTIKIFVASSSELPEEREKTFLEVIDVGKVNDHLKLVPVKWETDNLSGSHEKQRFQDEINYELDNCNIVLVLFYSKIGKFTLEEYHRARAKNKKVFLYFKKGFSPNNTTECNHYCELLDFKEKVKVKNNPQFKDFDNIEEFRHIIYKELNLYLNKNYPPSAFDDEEVQPNDKEKMISKKKVDRIANERKNSLLQKMNSHMVRIPAGEVVLRDKNSRNQFTAKVSSFFMDKYPVTNELYERVMEEKSNIRESECGDHPVVNVSWFDAVEFCNKLSEKTGLKPVYIIDRPNVSADWDAKGFRLPTEVEWRYACWARTIGERYDEINEIAWYKDNSEGKTHKVGDKKENPWGLFDMLGNVWEWCWDWSGDYPEEDKKDWRGPKSSFYEPPRRITPGGGWNSEEDKCTCNYRNHGFQDFSATHLGFRLAMSL
jgi:formylglycine-generating enzyme required for sulfatase activity